MLGLINADRTKIQNEMLEAMRNGDAEKYTESFDAMMNLVEQEILEKAEELANVRDSQILAARGVRQLTNEETKFYEKLINALKSANPKQELTDGQLVFPQTVLDQVFEDLRTQHPLLSHLSFTNTYGSLKFLMSKNTFQKAVWGKLGSAITQDIDAEFDVIDMTLMKLTAYMSIMVERLDLGTAWIDNFVREVLYEALANGLEDGIINNLNSTTGPIGMIANLTTGAGGVGVATYTAKTATPISDLKPTTIGTELAKLAVDGAGKTRTISDVIMIVNPVDYFTKVFPATTVLAASGQYVSDILPYPISVIQSAAVASNRAILGLGKKYFMGIGMASKDGRIDYSDDYKWLDDLRTYKIKLYANGMPQDNNAFQYLDITNLKPAAIAVTVEGEIETTVDGVVQTQTTE